MKSYFMNRFLFLASFIGVFSACSTELDKDTYVKYYESRCMSEVNQSDFVFRIMELTPGYEKAKWGSSLDSSYRVLLWVYPRSDAVFSDVFILSKQDTIRPLATRKTPLFETGNTDSFSFVFGEKPRKTELHIQNYNDRIGNIVITAKNCQHIRLK